MSRKRSGGALSTFWKGSPVSFCAAGGGHVCAGAVLLRGLGGAAEKSAELSPVSAHPSPFLTAALFVPGAGAGAVSEQLADVP